MGIKIFMISFMVTSILFFLFHILTKLTIPISNLRPIVNYPLIPKASKSYPVSFAHLISASKDDLGKLKKVIRALCHPESYYLIHLDHRAPKLEHKEIVEFVALDSIFGQFGNVWVMGKRNLVTYKWPTMLATPLHAMAMLLRSCKWDWFINLSTSDYPLVTQNDPIQAFSELPKDVNFIKHSSHLG